MRQPFETLLSFQDAVKSTIVLQDGERVSSVKLADGLNLAINAILKVHEKGKKLFVVGNGGSAAIASHHALDLWNYAGVPSLAFNDASLLTCMANDFGYEEVFARPLSMFCGKGDLLIAISSSGASKNILRAVASAEERGATVIGFSGFKAGNPLSKVGKLHFYVPSHSYGVVEAAHFLLTHTVSDELAHRMREKKGVSAKKSSRPENRKVAFTEVLLDRRES
jgi:D-sedoheptulose 7-phosphate isomerase